MSYDSTLVGSTAIYICDQGYKFDSNEINITASCEAAGLKSGTWQPAVLSQCSSKLSSFSHTLELLNC